MNDENYSTPMNNGLNYPTLPQKHISIFRWLDAHQERQIVVLAASLLIVLWIGLTYWVVGAREQILQSRRETLVQTAEVAAGQTRQLLGQIRASLHATNHWLALHPNVDPGNSREFISLVNGLREASGNRIDVRMVTRDAKLAYVPNRITASETDVSDREYYSAQQSPNTRGFYIASTVFSRVTKKWGIPISAPVDPLNRYVSIVFGAIELETLHEMQKPLLRDAGASVTLLRNDSNILSRLPLVPELIGKKLEFSTDWIEHISKGGQGSFVSDRAPTDGRRRLVAYAQVDDYPVTAVVTVPLSEVLSSWWRQVVMLVSIAVLISVSFALFAFRLVVAMRERTKALRVAEEQAAQLESANRELAELSVTDRLTQVFNRAKLDTVLASEVLRTQRYCGDLSLILLDIDHFKRINDEHGHTVGDEVLVRLADLLRLSIRRMDTLGRWGGEEFVIILPNTSRAFAQEVAEKLRLLIAATNFPIVGQVTLSLGVTACESGDSENSLFSRADKALYSAKNLGRNNVYVA